MATPPRAQGAAGWLVGGGVAGGLVVVVGATVVVVVGSVVVVVGTVMVVVDVGPARTPPKIGSVAKRTNP